MWNFFFLSIWFVGLFVLLILLNNDEKVEARTTGHIIPQERKTQVQIENSMKENEFAVIEKHDDYKPNESLRPLIKACHTLFRELHEYQVPFFAISGTLLGVIRHGGVIPWDTDIDIGIMKKDVPKLFAMLGHCPQYQFKSALNRHIPHNDRVHIENLDMYYDLKAERENTLLCPTNDLLDDRGQILVTRGTRIVEIEIFEFYTPEQMEEEGLTFWKNKLTKDEHLQGYYVYTIKAFRQAHKGKLNVPAIFMQHQVIRHFYEDPIAVFRDHMRYIVHRFGKEALTHFPGNFSSGRKETGSIPIQDFSAL